MHDISHVWSKKAALFRRPSLGGSITYQHQKNHPAYILSSFIILPAIKHSEAHLTKYFRKCIHAYNGPRNPGAPAGL